MSETQTYPNPPVIELVLGAQFAPLDKFTAGHFGAIWDAVGRSEWVTPTDSPELEIQTETFGQAHWLPPSLQLKFSPIRGPGRLILANATGDQIVQIQRNRLHMNWRKGGTRYPSYKKLIAEFLALFDRVDHVAKGSGLGEIRLDQWEITYIDAFAHKEYWNTTADWPNVLPGLFGRLFATDGTGLELERRAAEWTFEIAPRLGRLHVAAHMGMLSDEASECLMLNMTARGPLKASEGREGLVAGLDIGHRAAVAAFERSASQEARARWGEPT